MAVLKEAGPGAFGAEAPVTADPLCHLAARTYTNCWAPNRIVLAMAGRRRRSIDGTCKMLRDGPAADPLRYPIASGVSESAPKMTRSPRASPNYLGLNLIPGYVCLLPVRLRSGGLVDVRS